MKSFVMVCQWLLVLVSAAFGLEENATHCGSDFCTWWHNSGEVNYGSPVQPGNVRQSRRYLVSVSAPTGDGARYRSFVYESIPRSGNGRVMTPGDAPDSNTFAGFDGVTIEPSANITMAWTQFEYSQAVDVKILRYEHGRGNARKISVSEVVIRPLAMRLNVTTDPADGGLVVRVPFDRHGQRFSVEFQDELYSYRSDGTGYVPGRPAAGLGGGPEGRDGRSGKGSAGGSAEVVSVEPTNALLVFASPFLPPALVPPLDDPSSTHTMTPGPIGGPASWGDKPVLYFPPGVYWMDQDAIGRAGRLGQAHLVLHPLTRWVHLAPGAYVKAAVEYTARGTGATEVSGGVGVAARAAASAPLAATGHGVLSGEHYVYQANPAQGYRAVKSDWSSLRMWRHFNATAGQSWQCVGPVVTAPPFNTMDLNSESQQQISVHIEDYKQVWWS
jgi:hypothetical protein